MFAWNVGSIVQEIAARCGVPYDRIETDLLEGYVEGFSTTNAQSGAAAVETLGGMFLFDPSNYDGALHFIPRGGNVVADLVTDDLIDDGKDIEKTNRSDSITIPRVVHLEYFDTDGGLTPDKQTSDRTLDDSRNKAESVTQTTIIMRADDAARAVVISHKVSIEEQRGELEFSLPMSWLQLTCADIITLNGARVRITDIEIDDGQQNYKAIYDRVSAYQSTISGVPIDQPSEPPELIISPCLIEIIDSHILSSADDQLGYYVAVSSETQDWRGASVELSKDGGANWIDGDSTTSNAIMGSLALPLPAHTHWYRDDTNTLTVELLREDMELLPATMTEMLNRVNLAIVGDELINFSDADQVGPTTWELRGLLRGRKGSGAVSHAVGERFVLLDSFGVTFVPAELFELGRDLTFRVTSFGAEPGPDSTTITLIGRSQIERQPAYLHTRRDGANLVVSWQGVGRLGAGLRLEWVPISPDTE
ncbi:phage tail protein [Pseudomonas sp. MDMC_285]|nr:phage tail protein [Pseudomonas sp. MDMC_285]